MDELNTPVFDFEEYIDDYFKPMQITKKQKEERKEASRDLFDLLLLIFALLSDGWASTQFIIDKFNYELRSIAMTYGEVDDYYDDYVDMAVNNIMTTTMAHLMEPDKWLTQERAAEIAVNEANTILNYKELIDAKAAGYTSKTWKAENDKRTRKDHVRMDGRTIAIDAWFVFPDCHVQMPRDEVNGTAKQTVNCRCVLQFGNATVFDDMPTEYEDVGVRISQNTAEVPEAEPDLPYREVSLEEYQNFNIEAKRPIETTGVFTYLGKIYKVGAYEKDGIKYNIKFDPDAREREVAQLLIDKLGGVVQLMPKFNSPQSVRCPDFMFRGKRFDYKQLVDGKGKHLISTKLRAKHGKIQAENAIIDISAKSPLSVSDVIKQITELYGESEIASLPFIEDIILMKDNEIIKIFKRK